MNNNIIIQESNNRYDALSALTIAFVYVFFIALLIDRLLDYDSVDKLCAYSGLSILSEEYANKQKACTQAKKEYETKKFTYMIIIGVASIFGGILLDRADKMYSTGGLGVASGGVMLVVYYTIMNWSLLDKNFQVAVLGITFAALFYGSVLMY